MTVGPRNSHFLPDRGPVKYRVTLLLFLVARPVERDEGEAVERERENSGKLEKRAEEICRYLSEKLHNYWQQGENEEGDEDEDEDEEEFLEGSQS